MSRHVHAPEKSPSFQYRQKESGMIAPRAFSCRGEDGELDGDQQSSPDIGFDLTRTPIFPPIQAKLTINQPGDRYEEEADRAAEQVMCLPHPETFNRPVPLRSSLVQRSCQKCKKNASEDDEERLQMKPASRATPESSAAQSLPSSVPPIVHEVLRSPGRSLDAATRAFMEPRFGHDFSRVRVHEDARASESARAVNANAFTVGYDVVFRIGEYSPGTNEGQRLMAHELTHVVQQMRTSRSLPEKLTIGQTKDVHAVERNIKDKHLIPTMTPLASSSFVIQRDPGDKDEAQGTSFYSDPQPSNDGLVARIYFPTSGTELDSQDTDILRRVIDHYQISLLGNHIHFEIIGTADWRPANNERLARERARSVMEYLDSNLGRFRYYSSNWHGVGAIGTPDSGSTAEELNEFRRADIITTHRPRVREPEPEPEPQTPESVHSTRFKARIAASAGGGYYVGIGYGVLEIVDITNHRRRYYQYTGLGLSAGLSSASGTSNWQEFTTTVPMRVDDFNGPVFHTAGGVALGHGPMVETFRLIAPVIYGGDSVLLEFVGLWEEGWSLGAGVDFGPLDPISEVDRVPENYN